MHKTLYEDNKYCMQDTGNLYVGTKYTFSELLDEESILFKFRLVVERYILPETDVQDTLETHLYYLKKESFLVRIYKQLKARVKINIIEDKVSLTGKHKKQYTTKILPIEALCAMSAQEKEEVGLVVQELIISKLALMTF